MSRRNKWPAKALNLLVALAMVISLCAVFAPAVAAQSYNPNCNPVEEWTPCHLEVFLNTYIKDANGDFTAEDTFNVCQNFYVNAVVVNTGNATATAPITATIDLTGLDVSLVSCAGNDAVQTADEPLAKGEMVDFWWLLHCDAGTGWQTITVDVMDDGDACPAMATIDVYQTVPTPEKCVEIEIIEAPGLNSALPQTVVPCTNFGIKANITNNCSYELNDVNGTIRWGQGYDAGTDKFAVEDTAADGLFASIVYNDPLEWCVGDLAPGEWATVGWTLHCDAPGDIEVLVQAKDDACGPSGNSLHEKTVYINDPWTVHQLGAGEVELDITWPPDGYEVCQSCTIHGLNAFTVDATVTNNSDLNANGVYVIIVGNNTALFTYKSPTMVTIGDMVPGASAPVSFDLSCKAPGALKFTVTAYFTTTEGPGTAEDTVLVNQKNVIATVYDVSARDPVVPDYVVNVCNTFDVIGSFRNCTGSDLTYVNVCIIWLDSDARLIVNDTVTNPNTTMNPVYDRCLGAGWHLFDGVETGSSVLSKTIVPLGGGLYMNCQQVAICNCCETRVRWTFQCVDDGDVTVKVLMTKTVGATTWTDDSDQVLIDQVWKAHLIGGAASYLQNECGAMLQRDAFAPCQDFHVVMPVANVGDADATSVMVNFAVIAEEGVYDLDDIVSVVSGDLLTPTSYTFNPATGLGTATIGTIPGDSARKVILHMHCAAEGDVQFLITGITGIDENTGKAIDPDNIELPPCPITVEQIPFTVQIINPENCDTFNQYDRFAVKALITNGSDTDLGSDVAGVWAELFWTGDVALVSPQNNPKRLGNSTDWIVAANSVHEVTWEMQCTGPGEVFLSVTVTSYDPLLTTESDTVNVHQTDLPNIQVEILSPADNTYVATSQDFAVTVRVNNSGAAAAENVSVTAGSAYGLTSLADGESATKYYNGTSVNQMAAGAEWIVTWTMHADKTFQKQCGFDYDQIGVNASTDSFEVSTGDNYDYVYVYVYPAAHLVVEIGEMQTTIGVCDEFVLPYTVTNTGEADAWETSVTLSVIPEGSVRIAEGHQGYTQPIGTLPGWESEDNSYTGTFTLHCKQACESTLTITPAGFDECGFTMVECDMDSYQLQYGYAGDYFQYMYGPYYWYPIIYCDWDWIPGAPIRDMFLEPDSVTVKQVAGIDLGITKAANKSLAAPEDQVVWTIKVTNYGPENASGVVVTDAWSPIAELSYYTHTVTQGTFNSGTGVWTVGGLVVGASATLQLTTTVGPAPVEAVTNTATITDVDQPDGDPSNDSASATINMTGTALDVDWNLISLPLIPTDPDIDVVLAGITGAGEVQQVYAYDPVAGWTDYVPLVGGLLAEMVDGAGYWIDMDGEATLTVEGVEIKPPPDVPPSYDVVVGWNLVGFKSTSPMAAGDYLNAIVGKWTRIYGYADGAFFAVLSGDMMQPGLGYWLAVIDGGTIYP